MEFNTVIETYPAVVTEIEVTAPFATEVNNGTVNITNTGSVATIDFVATEDIIAYAAVTSTGKSADSSNVTHRDKIIGINNASTLNGFAGTATGFGNITNAAWSWVAGDKIYLNGTALSNAPPASGFVVLIGTATAPDTINVNIQPSILL